MLALAVIAALGLTSCSHRSAAQPAATGAKFSTGDFDQLPHYPRTSPAGSATQVGDHTARSYTATGATPEQVVRWYTDNLNGWRNTQPPAQTNQTWAAEWVKGNRRLRVTAAPAPTEQGSGSEPKVQYSLELAGS